MSLNNPPVSVAKVIDPRLNINNSRYYVALKGASVNNFQSFPATNVNNSSTQITMNPPSSDIVISKLMYKKFIFDVSLIGTNVGPGNLLNDGFYAPRFLPCMQVTTSESITIGNDTFTQSPINQYFNELLRYNNMFHDRFTYLSLSPSMMDQSQEYSDLTSSVRNPLATYGNNSYEVARGSYVGMEVLTNTPLTATIRLTVIEPIMISPLIFGERSNNSPGIVGVENMSYTCTFGNLSRCMSLVQNQGSPNINITTVNVNLSSSSILCNYLTPDPLEPIPKSLVCPYFSIISYPTRSSVLINPGNSVSLTMQSVQVNSIPRRIYIYARQDDSLKTAFTSDACFSLGDGNPLTVNWNNNIFLSSATSEDLYNISCKNGCNLNYTQFKKETGSVLCLEFGTDIGLQSNQAPGLLGNYQLQVTCNFKNTGSIAVAPTLYCVIVSEGTFNINNGSCSHMIGVLSQNDVLNSKYVSGITYQNANDIYGGNFFDTLKNVFSKVGSFIKDHKIISKGLGALPFPQAQAASKLAETLGFGDSGGGMSGGRVRRPMNRQLLLGSGLPEDNKKEKKPKKYAKKKIYNASDIASEDYSEY